MPYEIIKLTLLLPNMKKEIDIHNYEKKFIQTIKNLEKSSISKRNKEIILKFKDKCIINGLGKPRIIKYLWVLRIFAKYMNKDFDKTDKQDIEGLVSSIQQQDLSVHTKHCYKVILKRFYKWLKGNDEDYPLEVKWIKCNVKRSECKLPSEGDLLSEEDVKKLIETCEHPRDKAFLSMLYESGCRVGEIASLQIGNVSFDEHGILIVVEGKTGSRKLRLIASTPYLSTWLQSHPLKDNKEAPLWICFGSTNHNLAVRYSTIRGLLIRLMRKTGIKKRINPHSFRHARATYLANHLTEFQMNQYFGWVQGSDMPSVYVHLSGRETDAAILELNGIRAEKQHKESELKPRKCPRCEALNPYNGKFCLKCAAVIDINTAIEIEEERKQEIGIKQIGDELLNALMQDKEIQKVMVKKILELGLKDKIMQIEN